MRITPKAPSKGRDFMKIEIEGEVGDGCDGLDGIDSL